MTTFNTVTLYPSMLFTDSNSNVHEYSPEDHHRPYFKTNAQTVPSFANPFGSYQNVTPRKGKEFSEMELPIDYSQMTVISDTEIPEFIEVKVIYPAAGGTTREIRVYGWIDGFSPIATKGPNQNTLVRWHIDHYITWNLYNWYKINRPSEFIANKRMSFKSGRLLRGPDAFKKPSSTIPTLWLTDKVEDIITNATEYWAIVAVVENTVVLPVTTSIVYYYFPIDSTLDLGPLGIFDTPSWRDIYSGTLADILQLDPDKISGAWIAPMSPALGNTTQRRPDPLDPDHEYAVYKTDYYLNFSNPAVKSKYLVNPVMSDDDHRIVFVDTTGAEMYKAPWGLEINAIHVWLDIGTGGANICVYLASGSTLTEDRPGEGRFFTFPLPALPITSNAWSSYVYSGQREYDVESRRLQRKEQTLTSLANIGTSAVGGAIAGSMIAPGPGTVIGAIAGAGVGATGTIVGHYIGREYDDRNQLLSDKLISNQAANMIVSAGSYMGTHPSVGYYTGGWTMVTQRPDPISRAAIASEQAELGYETNIFVNDCTSIIESGGGLRIDGLIIDGNIPLESRAEISRLFERGVHLDLIP